MISSRNFWLGCTAGLAGITVLLFWLLSQWYLHTFTQEVANRLQLLGDLRRGAVEQYFSTAEAELRFWSTNPDILASQTWFNHLWLGQEAHELADQMQEHYIEYNPHPSGEYHLLDDAGDGSHYSVLHGRLHPKAKLFVTERGYYDVFLIGLNGDVYYTVEKEADFGSNLLRVEYKDTGLAEVYRRALEQRESGAVVISDMAAYAPSGGAPAMFMARVLKDGEGHAIGVIAFQLPTSQLVSIMNYRSGMGDTGETYLVGQDGVMRSNSRFSESSTILQQQVDTTTSRRALSGGEGVDFVEDYRGVEVLSAYTELEFGRTSWAVMAEIDSAEITASAANDRPSLSGILMLFYGLSLWSVWYWRGRHMPVDGEHYNSHDLQLDASDFPDTAA